MKISLLCIALLAIQFVFTQEKLIDNDSIKKNEKSEFIKDYRNQLNIKLQLSNDVQIFYIPIDKELAEISPNMGIRYALNFNYRFLSIGFGIRPNKSTSSEENKGKTTVSDFKIKLLFNRWAQKVEYNKVAGFYIKNDADIFPSTGQGNRYAQLPNFTTKIISGNTSYKINDHFSLKSTQSQTEIQLKSAGSFIPNLNYQFYKIDGINEIIDGNGAHIDLDNYNDYKGVSVLLNLSYNYNFVIKKWFVNIALDPGIGVNYYKETNYNKEVKRERNLNNFVVSARGNIGAGYNVNKIYFGVEYLKAFTHQNNHNSELPFETSSHNFFAYFGYRFRAPKALSKPVKYIEKKIPILE